MLRKNFFLSFIIFFITEFGVLNHCLGSNILTDQQESSAFLRRRYNASQLKNFSDKNLDLLMHMSSHPKGVSIETLSDEIVCSILGYLIQDLNTISDFAAFACTNKRYNNLCKDSYLLNNVMKTCFNHIPISHLQTLIQDKNVSLSSQIKISLDHLLPIQEEEFDDLKKRLSDNYSLLTLSGDDPEEDSIQCLNKEFKIQQLEILNNYKKPTIRLLLYTHNESILNKINDSIIEQMLTLAKTSKGQRFSQHGWKNFTDLSINLKGAITRLPEKGLNLISDKTEIQDDNINIKLTLSCNNLRWLHPKLFSIPHIKNLDLRNNFLTENSFTIPDLNTNLKYLNIGNFLALGDRCACCDPIGRRTSGNLFSNIPKNILKLKNLKGLNIGSVKLKEISAEVLQQSLPRLKFINLNHNDLKLVSNLGSNVRIMDIGNPKYGLITLDSIVWQYRFITYLSSPFSRILTCGINICCKHPYIIGSLAISFIYYNQPFHIEDIL